MLRAFENLERDREAGGGGEIKLRKREIEV